MNRENIYLSTAHDIIKRDVFKMVGLDHMYDKLMPTFGRVIHRAMPEDMQDFDEITIIGRWDYNHVLVYGIEYLLDEFYSYKLLDVEWQGSLRYLEEIAQLMRI